MKNGIGRATEVESDLPLPLARRAVQEPNVLLTADSEHLRTLQKCALRPRLSDVLPPGVVQVLHMCAGLSRHHHAEVGNWNPSR